MKIVVIDGKTLSAGDNPWDPLFALGDVVIFDRSPEDTVVDRARAADIIVTNKARVSAPAIDSLPSLRFIAVSATGYDCVDVAAARARGIPVSNVPEYGTHSVAQFT